MRVASYTLIISSEDHDCVDYVTFHRKSKVVQNIFKARKCPSTDTLGPFRSINRHEAALIRAVILPTVPSLLCTVTDHVCIIFTETKLIWI